MPASVRKLSDRPSYYLQILQYDGYTSCPLVTKKGSCILAEFGYDGSILETFPVNQAKERHTSYMLKAHIMPQMYWHGLLK